VATFGINSALDCSEVKLLEHGDTMINIVSEVADRIVLAADDINRKVFSGMTDKIWRCNIF